MLYMIVSLQLHVRHRKSHTLISYQNEPAMVFIAYFIECNLKQSGQNEEILVLTKLLLRE